MSEEVKSEVEEGQEHESNGELQELTFKDHQEPKVITIHHKDGSKKYTVNELEDGDKLANWMKSISKRMKRDGRGRVTKADFKGMHAELIARCLRYQDTNKLVPYSVIKSWGANVQNNLFSLCQEINGLTDEIQEAEGKD